MLIDCFDKEVNYINKLLINKPMIKPTTKI